MSFLCHLYLQNIQCTCIFDSQTQYIYSIYPMWSESVAIISIIQVKTNFNLRFKISTYKLICEKLSLSMIIFLYKMQIYIFFIFFIIFSQLDLLLRAHSQDRFTILKQFTIISYSRPPNSLLLSLSFLFTSPILVF